MRMMYPAAAIRPAAFDLSFEIKRCGATEVVIAGGLRRDETEVEGITFVVIPPADVINFIADMERLFPGLMGGSTLLTGRWNEYPICVGMTDERSWGGSLLFYTGSVRFLDNIRVRIQRNGFDVNAQGVWKHDRLLSTPTERQVFEEIGIPFVEPQNRR